VMGAAGMARGTRVRVRLGTVDDIALDVSGTVTQVLDTEPAASRAGAGEDGDDDEGEGDAPASGPLSIAVDMADDPAPGADGQPG
ncbi:MAG: RNB domain-containing ribonuclease, partial [Ottowia sp.]|nr:RNB domain-containing ribonuclease [Ottowia sp.]